MAPLIIRNTHSGCETMAVLCRAAPEMYLGRDGPRRREYGCVSARKGAVADMTGARLIRSTTPKHSGTYSPSTENPHGPGRCWNRLVYNAPKVV